MKDISQDHEILNESMFHIQVCSDGSIDDALEFIRTYHPSGTSNNWQIDDREESKPVKCADNPNRNHYVFVT